MAGFDRKRALLVALAPAALIVGYFAWQNHGRPPGNLVRFWPVALLVGIEAPTAFIASYLSQTGRRAAAGIVTLAGGLAFFGVGEYFRVKTEAVTLTDGERMSLVAVEEGGRLRLKHPTLGFSILHPGSGFVDQGGQAFRANAQFYSFVDRSSDAGLFVGLFKGNGDSPASLRELLEAMADHLRDSSGTPGSRVRLVDLETPATEPPRGTLHAIIGDHRHYRIEGHGWKPPDGEPSFAILIAVMAPTAEAYADVLASFRP